MKSRSEVKTIVYLELTQEEAAWLKSLVQNPIAPDETPNDEKMREQFFRALDMELGSYGK